MTFESRADSCRKVADCPADPVRVEKNLAAVGFFTASSKRTKTAWSKSVFITQPNASMPAEAAKATITPTREFGLPITSDLDKYLAFQKILGEIRQRSGEAKNPVAFSSAELLRILGRRVTAGKNYDDLAGWLRRMTLTAIHSEGAVYLAGRRTWAHEVLRVFDRSVPYGAEMPEGGVAQRNYVWLSDWQLENTNTNHHITVDLSAYRRLRNYIAKCLVPLLQIWLHSEQQDGAVLKSYDEVAQLLGIRGYTHLSKVREKLGPSLTELTACGYLSRWRIERVGNDHSYRVVFYPVQPQGATAAS